MSRSVATHVIKGTLIPVFEREVLLHLDSQSDVKDCKLFSCVPWALSELPSKGRNVQTPDLPRKAVGPKAHWQIVYHNGIQLWVQLSASKHKLASMLVWPSASHTLTLLQLMPVYSQALSLSPELQDTSFAHDWDHREEHAKQKSQH